MANNKYQGREKSHSNVNIGSRDGLFPIGFAQIPHYSPA